MPETPDLSLIALTSQIVSAHVAHNVVEADRLPALIRDVYAALGGVKTRAPEINQPAVPLKQSVRANAILCLECGEPFKILKRHLNTSHNLTIQQYRAKWGLPSNYPVVAPDYAETRSHLAKQIGLGRAVA